MVRSTNLVLDFAFIDWFSVRKLSFVALIG